MRFVHVLYEKAYSFLRAWDTKIGPMIAIYIGYNLMFRNFRFSKILRSYGRNKAEPWAKNIIFSKIIMIESFFWKSDFRIGKISKNAY